jgi:hypothetical protein
MEAMVVDLSLAQPAFGQSRIANEVRKSGHSSSPAGVRGVWLRHDLENTCTHEKKGQRREPGHGEPSPASRRTPDGSGRRLGGHAGRRYLRRAEAA